MNDYQLNKAVLFLVFNRPDVTTRVFAAIREAKPPRLYAAANGPREHHKDDHFKCVEVRNLITENIDWPCELYTLFRDEHLSACDAGSSAINWFFERENDGIILEDDILPHPDFFRFCEELLDKYADNEQVMHISGSNFNPARWYANADYYFSKYAISHGWATWKHSWQSYVNDLAAFDYFPSDIKIIPNEKERNRFVKLFLQVRENADEFNSWDFQWLCSILHSGGLAVQTNINLISNLCLDAKVKRVMDRWKTVNIHTLKLPETLVHPKEVKPDLEADISFRFLRLPLLTTILRYISAFILPKPDL